MKDDIKNVRLSFQCPQDWNCMKETTAKERFCANCKHAVKDFTKSNQQELAAAIGGGTTRVCGRFTRSQLSSEFLKYAAASVLGASLLTACETPAIEPTPPAEIQMPFGPEGEEMEIWMGEVMEIEKLDTLRIETLEKENVEELKSRS